MTSADDDLDMRAGRDLDDRLVEELLHGGSTWLSAEHRDIAAAIESIRSTAAAPRPDAPLRQLFAQGLAPATARLATDDAAADRATTTQRLGVRQLAAKVAGLSLAFKLLLGGAAIAATTVGGAGVAGILPGQLDRDPDAVHPEIGQDDADQEGRGTPSPDDPGEVEPPVGTDRSGDGAVEADDRRHSGGNGEVADLDPRQLTPPAPDNNRPPTPSPEGRTEPPEEPVDRTPPPREADEAPPIDRTVPAETPEADGGADPPSPPRGDEEQVVEAPQGADEPSPPSPPESVPDTSR